MRKFLAAGIAAIVLFAAGTAAAGEYALIFFDHYKAFVRLDNVERKGDRVVVDAVRLWPETVNPGEPQTYRYIIVRLNVDCAGRRTQDLSLDLYSDRHVRTVFIGEADEWRGVEPDSMGEAMLQAACAPDAPDLERATADTVAILVQPYL